MVDRAPADGPQTARPRRFQDRPTRSPAAPPRRPTRTIAPSSNSPPAGSRCGSCASRRWRSPISPVSPKASPIRSRWRAPYYWQGRAAEALGRGQDARAHYEAAARYPTAYYGQLSRARLGLDAVTLRNLAGTARRAPSAGSRPRLRDPLRLDERDLVAIMAADLADKTTDAAGAGDARGDRDAPQRRARDALDRQDRARPRLAVRALRVSRLRRAELPADRPEVERCVVYSIVRQESAFNPGRFQRQRARPDAGDARGRPRYREAI